MYAYVVPLSLVTVAFVLEGCGGGSGSSPCHSESLEIVRAQTLKGTMSGTQNVPEPGTHSFGTFGLTFDLDKQTFVMQASVQTSVVIANVTTDVVSNVSVVVNAKDKSMVTFFDNTCRKKTIDNFASVAILINSMLQKMQCKDRIDGADKYETSMSIPQPNMSLTMTGDLEVDDDHLIRRIHQRQVSDVKVVQQKIHIETDGDMVVTDARIGGPSEADLEIPKFWGPCTSSSFEPAGPLESASLGLVMPKAVSFFSHFVGRKDVTSLVV